MPKAILAIDVGGTKLAAGVMSASGELLSRARRPTPTAPDGDEVYSALLEVVWEARRALGKQWKLEAVGVGAGGPMRMFEGLISTLNIPGWRHDFPIVARLEADLGLPVALDNDAKAFALGEQLFGAGRGHPDMLGVVVSTGVGGGVIIGGSLHHGRTGNAGHVGHQVAEPDGPRCACGGRGCVEAIASSPSIVRLVRAEMERGRETVLRERFGPTAFTAREVAVAAFEGDALARVAFERAGKALGVGFAGAAAILDVNLIVLGGGVSTAGDLLLRPVREALATYSALEYLADLQVTPAANGPDAGLVGAAALAIARRPGPRELE